MYTDLYRCERCGWLRQDKLQACYGCTHLVTDYSRLTVGTTVGTTLGYGEKDMCEKKEPATRWTLRIGIDGKENYTVEFKKRTSDEHQSYTVTSDDFVRTFKTFEEALKYTNETYKNLSK